MFPDESSAKYILDVFHRRWDEWSPVRLGYARGGLVQQSAGGGGRDSPGDLIGKFLFCGGVYLPLRSPEWRVNRQKANENYGKLFWALRSPLTYFPPTSPSHSHKYYPSAPNGGRIITNSNLSIIILSRRETLSYLHIICAYEKRELTVTPTKDSSGLFLIRDEKKMTRFVVPRSVGPSKFLKLYFLLLTIYLPLTSWTEWRQRTHNLTFNWRSQVWYRLLWGGIRFGDRRS